jgi:hypothetical protein
MCASVPLAYFVATFVAVAPGAQPEPNLAATFIALVPAMVGAYTGAALRTIATRS